MKRMLSFAAVAAVVGGVFGVSMGMAGNGSCNGGATACNAGEMSISTEAKTPATVVEIALGSKDHTTLVAALKAAGLVETLSGKGPFTVFGPTNAAFAKLPAGTVETLLKPENKAALTGVLTYHVVAGNVLAADAIKLDGKAAKTVNGAEINIAVKDGKVVLNGSATVVAADLKAGNGVVHVIDAVLLPPAAK